MIRKFYAPDVTVGARLELDSGGAVNNVRNFKKELQLAQQEVIHLSEKFGATSKEAAAAAKKAAELRDTIGDARSLVDAFNPDTKFRAFASSIQTIVGGFTALTGAMGLLGVESEEVQKTLLKVQSALALSQGLSQLQEGIQSIKNLGSVLINTLGKSGLIGIAIAGVTALGAAILGVFDGPSAQIRELNKSLKELGKGQTDARKEINETRNAFKQAELGIITKDSALKKYNEGIGETVGHAKDLNEAEKLTAENADKYIEVQGLKAQANYILSKSAELTAQAMIKEAQLGTESLGAFGERVKGFFRHGIEQSKKDGEELLKLIDGINTKIVAASSGFKVKTTTGKATTPAGQVKEKEVEEVSAFRKMLNQWASEDAEKEAMINDIRLAKTISTNEAIMVSDNASTLSYLENRKKQNEALALQQYYEETVANARISAMQSVGSALGALSELIGKQTAAGKVLAIAQATINMWLGVTEVLKNKTVLPEPFGTISKIASITTVVATGLNAIKNIVKTNVPGASGASGSVPSGRPSVSAPLSPRLPNATNTILDRDQLNQIGNATVRAFVIEHDVSSNQERIRRLNRAARI